MLALLFSSSVKKRPKWVGTGILLYGSGAEWGVWGGGWGSLGLKMAGAGGTFTTKKNQKKRSSTFSYLPWDRTASAIIRQKRRKKKERAWV